MRILGISCDYHDAAAALVVDGRVVAAAEEERFSRRKHDGHLPGGAVASCLAIGHLTPDDLDAVVLHEKPLGVASRVIASRQRRGPGALGTFAREMPTLLGRNLMIGSRIEELLAQLGATRRVPLRYSEHHLSHASAAFYPSPFGSAAILTVDGIGEWATATIAHGTRPRVDLLAEQRYPHSLGLLYSLFTVWCGFDADDGEYKLMGLAPYGKPRYADALAEIVDLGPDGSIHVDAAAVRWWSGGDRRGRLERLFGGPARRPGEPITTRHCDLARSVQELAEEAVLRMAAHACAITGEKDICLAGGVALNCVANGRLLRSGIVRDLWVQPAAGDAGSAIGAALWLAAHEGEDMAVRLPDGMDGSLLGPSFAADDVAAWLAEADVPHRRIDDADELCRVVADRLAAGEVVGWFRGRAEFGPRALGSRSILADPRSPTVQRDVNLRVKGRESFRPFAPAVLADHASEWFALDRPSPYMLVVAPVVDERMVPVTEEPTDLVERVQVVRSEVPACTHVDGSARVQTVAPDRHPGFHQLLTAFHAATGCPVLLNTSFNRAGEPIVCTPDDALASAGAAGLDLLVVEDCLVERADLPGVPA